MRSAVLALAAIGAAVPAFAQETARDDAGLYLGGGPAIIFFDDSALTGDSDSHGVLGGLELKAGWQFNRYFAVEAEYSFGIVSKSYAQGPFEVEVELDKQYGAYAVGRLPVSRVIDFYARLGISTATTTGSVGGTVIQTNEDEGAAYGAGLDFSLARDLVLRADYTAFDIEPEGSGLSFLLLKKF
jgi:opacity protein-like surface antigen